MTFREHLPKLKITFKALELSRGEIKNGGVGMRQDVDVWLPAGGGRVALYEQMDGQHYIGHGLQQRVPLNQRPDRGGFGRLDGHHGLPRDFDDLVALLNVVGDTEAQALRSIFGYVNLASTVLGGKEVLSIFVRRLGAKKWTKLLRHIVHFKG